MNSVGSSPGMNRLPRTRQPGGWLSVRSRPQLLTLTWCISDGVLPRNVSPIHAPGDPAVSMPRMTMGADAEPCARSDPAPYLPNGSPEVSANSTVAPASIVRVPRTESRPCTTCGDSARVHVSLAVIDKVWLVECGPAGSPQPSVSTAAQDMSVVRIRRYTQQLAGRNRKRREPDAAATAECKVVRRSVGRATHPLHRLHTERRRLPRIPPNRASRRLPTRCAACIPSRQAMKTLRVALVAALVAGCHFDKLFNSTPGGSHAPPPGSAPPRLAFTVQPTDAMKDSMITPPVQVTVFDSAGNVMTSFTGDVTLALGKDPSVPKARLSGRSQAAASGGVATFPDLSIDQIDDGYRLVATASGLPNAISTVFTIVPGTATQLVFTVPPSNTAARATIQPPVQVTAYDAFGNQATNFIGSVLVAIGRNGGLLVPGTLSGNGAVPAVNGVATFPNLSIDVVGNGYTLTAAFAGGAVVVESPSFNITVL